MSASVVREWSKMGASIRIRLTSEETGTSYSLIEMSVPSHFPIAPTHHHTNFVERFIVLDGEIDIELNGVAQRLRSGESAQAEPGTRHSLRNASERPAHLLLLVMPGGHERFFYELMEWMDREPKWPPPDRERLVEFGLRHDTYYA
jgi:quercetin dioxygenase-like cupin family protein